MALVADPSDPSGSGMFSKPGRFTFEKYMIFHRKDEILNNQKKYYRVSALPQLGIDQDERSRPRPREEEEEKPKSLPKSKSKPVVSIFEKTLSREEVERIKGKRFVAPPIGFYNPKYKAIEKKTVVLFNYDSEKPKQYESPVAHLKKSLSKTEEDQLYKPVPEFPKHHTFTCIDFDKQLERGRFFKPASDPHEDRFKPHPIPKVYSGYKYIYFKKSIGREKFKLFKDMEFAPDYSPNWEFGKKRIIKPGPKFETYSPRKPLNKPSVTLTDSSFFLTSDSPYFKKKMGSPKFDKILPREVDPNTPLPSFMQVRKSVTSRISIGQLSQKTLEINGFSNGEMRSLYSSFSFKGKTN